MSFHVYSTQGKFLSTSLIIDALLDFGLVEMKASVIQRYAHVVFGQTATSFSMLQQNKHVSQTDVS